MDIKLYLEVFWACFVRIILPMVIISGVVGYLTEKELKNAKDIRFKR